MTQLHKNLTILFKYQISQMVIENVFLKFNNKLNAFKAFEYKSKAF